MNQNQKPTVVEMIKAVDAIHAKSWSPDTVLVLGINEDATKVMIMTAAGGKQEVDHQIDVDTSIREKYGFLAHVGTNGVTQLIEGEDGRIGALLESKDAGIRQRMTKFVDALRGWQDCFFALPTDHGDIGTWLGAAERMERIGGGHRGELQNLRFVGQVGAIATRGDRLYAAATDDKGRITPSTPWNRKFDFRGEVGFVSRVDEARKNAIVSLKGGKYHVLGLHEMFAKHPNPTLQVSSVYHGNGAYIVGLTPKGDALAEINRTKAGAKNVHLTPFGNGAGKDGLPQVARAAYLGTQAQA